MPSRPEAVRRLLVLGLTVEQNVAEIVACGRTRWKIENEGFNVMKNDGYEFEHNFSHGARFPGDEAGEPEHPRLRLTPRSNCWSCPGYPIAPMDLANMRGNGVRSLAVSSWGANLSSQAS